VSATLAQFEKQIAGGELKPVYLIAGEEHLLVLEAADALRARARVLGYAERDVLDVESRFDWNALAQSASAMSLFATRRLIDLRLPTGKAGRDGGAALIEYCSNPPPDTVLLITAMEWSRRDHEPNAWVAAVDKAGTYVPVWPMKLEELPGWIARRMASRGLKPDRAAIEALAERVEGNSLAAAQEIDKLALLHGSAPLDADTLEQLVADSARFDVFKLIDAALRGDAARALRILDGLRAEGEQVPGLMGMVLYKLQQLARGEVSGRGDRRHWEACLQQAARIDRISKGREIGADGKAIGDAWRELERLLVAIGQPRAALSA
jgi:DNA polymerase-3 subunit delta